MPRWGGLRVTAEASAPALPKGHSLTSVQATAVCVLLTKKGKHL